jgi:ATP-dependent DNA helicase RecG
VQVEAEVVESSVKYRPKRQLVVKLAEDDRRASLWVRFLNFYPSQVKQFAPASACASSARCARDSSATRWCTRATGGREGRAAADSLTPVYPTTAGLSQSALRAHDRARAGHLALEDTLDAPLLAKLGLAARSARACSSAPPAARRRRAEPRRAHAPGVAAPQVRRAPRPAARHAHRLPRAAREGRAAAAGAHTLTNALVKSLPFPLTGARRRAPAVIAKDLAQRAPDAPLLQGDVGSGKTLVAALAALQAIENGWQAALMAPTEILAEQHYLKLTPLAGAPGREDRVALGEPQGAREEGRDRGDRGGHDAARDRHARALPGGVAFATLGLAIVDEQHRFGVEQRLALSPRAASRTS